MERGANAPLKHPYEIQERGKWKEGLTPFRVSPQDEPLLNSSV